MINIPTRMLMVMEVARINTNSSTSFLVFTTLEYQDWCLSKYCFRTILWLTSVKIDFQSKTKFWRTNRMTQKNIFQLSIYKALCQLVCTYVTFLSPHFGCHWGTNIHSHRRRGGDKHFSHTRERGTNIFHTQGGTQWALMWHFVKIGLSLSDAALCPWVLH